MFLFKKIVGPFFAPLTLVLGILVLGLLFLWFTRRRRTGKILVTIGTLLLLSLSYGPLPGLLLKHLERTYPALITTAGSKSGLPNMLPEIKYIVVLGGGHTPDPKIPAASQLSTASLVRLVEGIRLHRELPGTKLILTGGRGFGTVPEAETLSQVAQAIGVVPDDLIVEKLSRDTEDQARSIREIVGSSKFILVTSAAHLPRALALFKRQGLEPVPCPVGHLIKESPTTSPGIPLPSVYNLDESEVALREYLGMGWARLRGRI